MDNSYFKVELTDGRLVDFDRQCTKVEYSDRFAIFMKANNEATNMFDIIAAIPYESIYSIWREEKPDSTIIVLDDVTIRAIQNRNIAKAVINGEVIGIVYSNSTLDEERATLIQKRLAQSTNGGNNASIIIKESED